MIQRHIQSIVKDLLYHLKTYSDKKEPVMVLGAGDDPTPYERFGFPTEPLKDIFAVLSDYSGHPICIDRHGMVELYEAIVEEFSRLSGEDELYYLREKNEELENEVARLEDENDHLERCFEEATRRAVDLQNQIGEFKKLNSRLLKSLETNV